jgi:Na+/proline symporter
MPSPSTLAQWVGFLLFGGFFGVVFWKLVTGTIPLDQLLEKNGSPAQVADENAAGSSSPSAGRAQSLAVTLFVALYYLVQVIRDPKQFPEIPGTLVALLAGSQAMYLGGKARDMLPGSWRDFLK